MTRKLTESCVADSALETSPSIGIAVPVKNGEPYVWAALDSLLNSSNPNLNVLVSVDQDEHLLEKLRSSIDDPRFIFRSAPAPLSMAGHYEFLLDSLEAEWLSILGQDDGINSQFDTEALRAIQVANSLNIEAVSFRRAYFNWQDGTSDRLGYVAKYAAYGTPRIVNSSAQVEFALFGLLSHFDLPQAYTNNLIHTNAINRVRDSLGGRLIHEPIPDTFLGVAIAKHTQQFLRWPNPAFWTGTSSASAGHRPKTTTWLEGRPEVPEHISLALTEGRDFGVGVLAWEKAQSSPLMINSALSVVDKLEGNDFGRMRNIFSLSAALGDSLVRFSILGRIRLPRGLLSDILRCCSGTADRFLVVAFSPCFILVQIGVRAFRKFRFDYFTRRTGIRVVTGPGENVSMQTLNTLLNSAI